MQVLIENTLTAQTDIKELRNQTYRLGRAADCEIVLNSRFVSPHHAQISYSRRAFTIQATSVNCIYVNDSEVERDDSPSLNGGDRIRIGEYVITIIADDTNETKSETRGLNFAKKLVEQEVKIHDELLQRLDLRKSNIGPTNSEAHVQMVHRHLSQLLNEYALDLSPEVEKYAVRETLKMELMDRITVQDNNKRRVAVRYGNEAVGEHDQEAEKLRNRLVQELQLNSNDPKENVDRLEAGLGEALDNQWLSMSGGFRRYLLRQRIRKDIHDIIFGYGPLQDLLNSPIISEIMVVSRSQIYVEKNGKVEDSGRAFVSDEVGYSIIERIVAPIGRRIDKSQPLVDARLPDGSRVNAIIPPLALKGPCITIRKFSRERLTVGHLIEWGTLNHRAANFLKACVRGKKNIIISGGTGSGKTTLLNVLSGFIREEDRIVTIEDSAELQLAQKHVVQLETRPPNIEGGGAFTIRDLVKNSLRMRPDRIIVGECRSSETLDMLQAMNTGHSGSMTTAHANNPEDLVLRLETMVMSGDAQMPVSAIRSQIASALDLIIQQTRLSNGKRRVTNITEVIEKDEETGQIIQEDIFVYRPDANHPAGGELVFTGYVPTFMLELLDKGHIKLEEVY